MMRTTLVNHRCRPRERRAVVLIAILTCLAVAMALFLTWLKMAALERRQLQVQQDRMQADLLAEAGLDRAAAQLITAHDYSAETWRIGPESLAGRGAAIVSISVEQVPDNAQARTVRAVAEYPVGSDSRVRRSKQITIVLPNIGALP